MREMHRIDTGTPLQLEGFYIIPFCFFWVIVGVILPGDIYNIGIILKDNL